MMSQYCSLAFEKYIMNSFIESLRSSGMLPSSPTPPWGLLYGFPIDPVWPWAIQGNNGIVVAYPIGHTACPSVYDVLERPVYRVS